MEEHSSNNSEVFEKEKIQESNITEMQSQQCSSYQDKIHTQLYSIVEQKKKNALIEDTYIIAEGSTYLIFSPNAQKIVRVDPSELSEKETADTLLESGFFQLMPDKKLPEEVDPRFGSMTLLLTRDCNLRCVYCYASAVNGPSMPIDTAEALTRWYLDQVPENRVPTITFHGGGEPSLALKTIKKVIETIEEAYADGSKYSITTNGTGSKKTMDFFIEKKFGITLSMDGAPEVQDRNRPLPDNRPSSPLVEKNVRYLVEKNYPFSVRVTYFCEGNLDQIIHYFGSLGVKQLHVEPAFPHGRDFNEKGKIDSIETLTKNISKEFVESMDIAETYGMKLLNGHLFRITSPTDAFCGLASGKSIAFTHEGDAVSCLEVVDKEDKDFSKFELGSFNQEKGNVDFIDSMVSKFKNRTVDTLEKCNTCFARNTCAGGCAVKSARTFDTVDKGDHTQCGFVQTAVPKIIQRIAKQSRV